MYYPISEIVFLDATALPDIGNVFSTLADGLMWQEDIQYRHYFTEPGKYFVSERFLVSLSSHSRFVAGPLVGSRLVELYISGTRQLGYLNETFILAVRRRVACCRQCFSL
jgi:hypothetical protein